MRFTDLIIHFFRSVFGSAAFLILLVFVVAANAENAAFDLIGPKVEVRVQRAGATLPIAEVPNQQIAGEPAE